MQEPINRCLSAQASEHPQRASPLAKRSLVNDAARQLLLLSLLSASAWVLHLYGRVLPTAGLACFWLAATALLAHGLVKRARIRRQAFLEAYLVPQSGLRSKLRVRWPLAIRESLVAAILAMFLLVGLIRMSEPLAWLALVASGPLMLFSHRLASRLLRPHANPVLLPEWAHRISLLGVGLLIFGVLIGLAFYRNYPNLVGAGLESAIWHFVDLERAHSAVGQIFLQVAAAKDALRLWLAQQLMPEPGVSLVQALGWLLVLAEEAVFVWTYLLLGTAILLRVDTDAPD